MNEQQTTLRLLAQRLADSAGLRGKEDIQPVVRALGIGDGDAIRVGDDTAAIKVDGGWNLLACEAMLPAFIEQMPWFAGFSSLWVNVSDIQAMGGRATAVVDALWAQDAGQATLVLDGLRAASALTGVPVVGGHANLQSPHLALSVSVLGFAKQLLTSFDAQAGDQLVAAIDLRGKQHAPWPFWDAASDAPMERIRADLELMPTLAESGLCVAAKDISQGGIIGTCALFAESSRVGMTLDIDAIQKPANYPLEQWLCTFPSFGYLMAVPPKNVDALKDHFIARGISAQAIGSIDNTQTLAIRQAAQREVVRDLSRHPLTGCASSARQTLSA
ncbi:sll0787 family AIR synthase-like protein [Granulosicoccus antarcticus]|uniref:Thiamine-monophosphate kinase n=1 Tax=Granulosicoccus antarcticus IMCC3135 TaxID=1192854 RepID=A0A2Z2NRA6_9GAMM|nr:sll0787 family AIR synthase-like protein [Granulosicoccus antarcticus]ASJ73769.1 Thiamine-monophosphate kinase [Granulosicoccus antarcticus IMCC3135]